jgi:hypothetical protein
MASSARQSPAGQAVTDRRRRLERERQRISAEICAYPAPIPACDAYFNFLLEERARLGELLSKLAEPAQWPNGMNEAPGIRRAR